MIINSLISLKYLFFKQLEKKEIYIAVVPSLESKNTQKDKPPLESLDFISYGIFGLIFLIFLLLEISWRIHNQKLKISQSPSFPNIPCYHCHYFKENPYLKCAVNPSKVLTLEAKNCLDFKECDYESSKK